MKDNKIIGNNYRYLRKNIGLTPDSIASVLRITSRTVYDFEDGNRKNLNINLCLAYYKYLGKHDKFPEGLTFNDTLDRDLENDSVLTSDNDRYQIKFVADHASESQTGHFAFQSFVEDPDISITMNPTADELEFLSQLQPARHLLITKQFYIGALYTYRKIHFNPQN